MASTRRINADARPLASVWVCVAEADHLCRVQRKTRAFCRRAGFRETDVFQSVIAVSELAFRLHAESSRRVGIKLTAHRHQDGLELRAENGAPTGRVSLSFARAAAAS